MPRLSFVTLLTLLLGLACSDITAANPEPKASGPIPTFDRLAPFASQSEIDNLSAALNR